jgi:hypothetical protein
MAEEQIVRHINETKDARPDSITIGTPSKGGEVKIYFNAKTDLTADFEAIINRAFAARKYAKDKLAEQEGKA